jgi:hypothetical protein
MNRCAIEKLERARDDLRSDDRRHRLRGFVHLVEGRHHRFFGRRLRDESEQHLCDHSERSFRTDEQVAH